MARIFYKNLQPRSFNWILAGTKTIEIRANKNENSEYSVNLMQKGDVIIFTNVLTKQQVQCTIKDIHLYSSVRDLLTCEGITNCLPDITNIEDGVQLVESAEGYKELIAKNGVFAIRITETKS